MTPTQSLDTFNSILRNDPHCAKFFDIIALTASNADQQHLFECCIKNQEGRSIPSCSEYVVISDPKPGIGNGNATLNALHCLSEKYDIHSAKILLIHSGGMSKRLPNQAGIGKCFGNMPFNGLDGQVSTMLVLKLIMHVYMPSRMSPGSVLVACADDIQFYNNESIENCTMSADIVGFGHFSSSLRQALGHGIYVVDENYYGKNTTFEAPCLNYIHKPESIEFLRKNNAMYFEKVLLDSAYILNRRAVNSLLAIIVDLDCELDGYGDFLQAVCFDSDSESRKEEYVGRGDPSERLIEYRTRLWDLFHHEYISMSCFVSKGSEFIHIGTLGEYIQHLTNSEFLCRLQNTNQCCRVLHCNVHPNACISDDTLIMKSVIEENCQLSGPRLVIEDSEIERNCVLGSDSLITGVHLPPDTTILPGTYLKTSYTLNGCVTVIAGIHDDFKASLDVATLLGVPILPILRIMEIVPAESFWHLCVFPLCKDESTSMKAALSLAEILQMYAKFGECLQLELKCDEWKDLFVSDNLLSMAQIASQLSQEQAFFTFKNQKYKVISESLWRGPMLNQTSAEKWIDSFSLHTNYHEEFFAFLYDSTLLRLKNHGIDRSSGSFQWMIDESRWCSSIAVVMAKLGINENEFEQLSSDLIRDCTVWPFIARMSFSTNNWIRQIWEAKEEDNSETFRRGFSVSLPIRLILSGGWTDTPPYCLEMPGHIVNFSALLNGKKPVVARSEIVLDVPWLFRFVSLDQNQETIVTSIEELLSYSDPKGPLAIHKAVTALLFCPWLCISSLWGTADLFPHEKIRNIGCGISLETECIVPKGSGLGTSSILALAMIRTLWKSMQHIYIEKVTNEEGVKHFDLDFSTEQNLVLAVEQMITTCGGWQDAVGGGTTGLKYTSSTQSKDWVNDGVLSFSISKINLSPVHLNGLNARLVSIYTGGNRLAKSILDGVVHTWSVRREGIEHVMEEISNQALKLQKVFKQYGSLQSRLIGGPVEDRLIEKAGSILSYVRDLNAVLEPRSCTPYLRSLYDILEEKLTGSLIMGAGEEGYIVGFTKAGVSMGEVNDAISSIPTCTLADISLFAD